MNPQRRGVNTVYLKQNQKLKYKQLERALYFTCISSRDTGNMMKNGYSESDVICGLTKKVVVDVPTMRRESRKDYYY